MEKRLKYSNSLPTCADYAKLLDHICAKTGININEARNKYGKFTYKDWSKII